MAKVEDHPFSRVQLVLFHNGAFYITASIQNVFNVSHELGPGGVSTEELKEIPVGNAAVLDHLRHTVGEGLVIQGIQGVRIHEHRPGLPEAPGQVLSGSQVDSYLSAYGGIHLGQEGGGDLNEIHAPEDGGGGEARQVPHHAAAQGNDGVGAGEAEVHHGLPQGDQVGGALGPLPGGACKQARIEAGGLQTILHPGPVEGLHIGIGNDGDPLGSGADLSDLLSHLVQQAGGDLNVIGAGTQVHMEGFHMAHFLTFYGLSRCKQVRASPSVDLFSALLFILPLFFPQGQPKRRPCP